jgi:hypothetical protein
MNFHSVGNFIIPTDEIIFFKGVGQPPTRIDRFDRDKWIFSWNFTINREISPATLGFNHEEWGS